MEIVIFLILGMGSIITFLDLDLFEVNANFHFKFFGFRLLLLTLMAQSYVQSLAEFSLQMLMTGSMLFLTFHKSVLV